MLLLRGLAGLFGFSFVCFWFFVVLLCNDVLGGIFLSIIVCLLGRCLSFY